ncbi:DUF3152 domain-containing protein [Corynebacterium liangguodongii]|uniref:Uncharacterized protein n=1 Tax=Corynebacterium liangguodongii TaxID=2079535 RepID=A0A2S0WCS2_9CORY|nr:DUF3152 domain-containing protein [Corynebacterium liangguodongii]AWB83560.1 hypothetical protein C3E79_02860 [Corynebacterium liangguodongii]PWC00351.1 DUF3152 domain-containing protein [Corynebacterium liangguodongii]
MTHRQGLGPTLGEDVEAREPFLQRFVREYGWRAYAIPVLSVITLLVAANVVANPDDAALAAPAGQEGAPHEAAGHDGEPVRDPAQLPEGSVGLNDLPPGGPYTEAGTRTYREVGAPGAKAGKGEELTLRYVVEVEEGIDAVQFGGDDALSALVDATLADPRGWTNDPRFGFEHVTGSENPDLRIRLTSAATTRENCGGDLGLETSCRSMATGESTVVLNEARWVRGAAPFEGDLGRYRQYLINHEVGHALGFAAHVACPADGELAPIMMQQTLSLNNAELHGLDPEEVYPDTPETCRANPWPYPRPAVL